MLGGRRGRTRGGPTHQGCARRPLECFPTVRVWRREWVSAVNHTREDDVLELVRIRSPQPGRHIDRLDGDGDRVTFADSVQKGTRWARVRIGHGRTYLIESWTIPFSSLYGFSTGNTSFFVATRVMFGMGECTRRVSRMTASKYGSAMSSSIDGVSVSTERSSSRSLV